MKVLLIADETMLMVNSRPDGAGDLILLTNKDLAGLPPVEIQVIPYGHYDTPKYPGMPYLCDEQSFDSVMNEFSAQTSDMVIDYEHQTLADPPVMAPAAGWIKKLVNKGRDGIWAVVDWTGKAKELIANREYRYVSPVFLRRKSDGRIMKLINVALTNRPNIDGMVPLTNKLITQNSKLKTALQKEEPQMKRIAAELGLPETATEEECVAAIKKMKEGMNSAVATNKAVVTALALVDGAAESVITGTIMAMKQSHTQQGTLAGEVETLKNKLKIRDEADIEVLVNSAIAGDGKGSKLLPAQKDWALAYAKRDLEGFKVFLNTAAYAVVTGKVVNDPAGGGGDQLDEAQLQVNKMMGIDAETFKKHNKVA